MRDHKTEVSHSTWTIRGISAEVRSASHLASKKSKLSIGKWVSRTLLEKAKEELKGSKSLARPEDMVTQITKMVDTLTKEIQEIKASFDKNNQSLWSRVKNKISR